MESGQFFQWHDLFVLIDDGQIPLPRYLVLETAMRNQARDYPDGIACLVILPPSTTRPNEVTQRAVTTVLRHVESSLSCLSYLVEGVGFKAVAARAALVGMKIFSSRPYRIYVEVNLTAMLRHILPHLEVGKTKVRDVDALAKVVTDARS